MGSEIGGFSDYPINGYPSMNGTPSPGFDEPLNYATLFNYKEPNVNLNSLDFPDPSSNLIPNNLNSSSGTSPHSENSDDSDSDDVLKYISTMLMEEDMGEAPCMFHDSLALQAAEKPFYDALGKKYPPSPNQHPLIDHFVESPDNNSWGLPSDYSGNHGSSSSSSNSSSTSSTSSVAHVGVADFGEHKLISLQSPPVEPSLSQPSAFPQWLFSPNVSTMNSSLGVPMDFNIFSEKESMIQFQKGVEEASKFLPKMSNLVVDPINITFPSETETVSEALVKREGEDNLLDGSRGGRIHYRENDEDSEEGRNSKQSAVSMEETELSELFDKVLLCPVRPHEPHCNTGPHSSNGAWHGSEPNSGSEGGKARSKKPGSDPKSTVDLRTLLVLCAQATASDDHRTADELLKQIRQHSSSSGDGSQRLAHYFANALEARLAGTGSQIYTALRSKRTTAAEMLKAFQVFVCASPFKKISIGFSIHMILTQAEKASKIHIIDFGILYGFQWPILIQRLSDRRGGPPKLHITGIDLPQPGFRPAERVEATGHRLAKYCKRFNVPFEYHAIAQKWETVKIEDIKISNDEFVVVNCLHRFKNLLDETIVVDSPRNAVLDLIRKIKPDLFLHGVVNGSYNAPFFVTRFREALFHYSTLFDMFDTTVSREDPQRLMFEKEFYGREIMNVVACEGTERIERPQTYKQWQVRNTRAGFTQIPLDMNLIKKLKDTVRERYDKDFVIDIDGNWTLQGWKGRIIYAISAWVPT